MRMLIIVALINLITAQRKKEFNNPLSLWVLTALNTHTLLMDIDMEPT